MMLRVLVIALCNGKELGGTKAVLDPTVIAGIWIQVKDVKPELTGTIGNPHGIL